MNPTPAGAADESGDRVSAAEEHHLTVGRTARYYTLGDPAGRLRQVWFVCHGYRQLAGRFIRRFRPLDDGTRLVVAPEALSRFYIEDGPGPHGPDSRVGATWMTREDRLSEIDDYVRYLDTLYDRVFAKVDRDAVEVIVLGFSQGAATASRWVALGEARADRLVLWASGVAHDLDLVAVADRLRATRPVLVAGECDEAAKPEAAARVRDRLAAHAIDARVLTHPGGHQLDEGVLRRIADGDV